MQANNSSRKRIEAWHPHDDGDQQNETASTTADVEQLYGAPQHETATTEHSTQSLYGPPQHESTPDDLLSSSGFESDDWQLIVPSLQQRYLLR